MNTHRITGALATLFVAGALVSCAADAEPSAAGDRTGKGKAAAQKQRGERTSVDKKRAAGSGQAAPGKERRDRGGSNPSAAGQSDGAGSTSAPQDDNPTEDQPAARPSCADDPSGDLESSGDAPAYADVTGGCLQADRAQLRLEARTVGAVPARMPDRDTQLSYGFELTNASGSTTYVHAQASPDGWRAYVSRGNSRQEIAAPAVVGNGVVLTLPLAELGAGRIAWVLEASWLESTLLGTSYAFDGAPNGGAVRFDR